VKIGAVLPLSIRGSYDNDDLGRIEIFFRTLSAFAEPGLFGTFLVVTPPNETEIVKEKCAQWPHFNVTVMSEESLVPELREHRQVRGWRKQQIVKLAAARVIEEDFYITFDADVVCLQPLSYSKLVIDGRALLQYESRELHPKWWKSSGRILKMNPNVGDVSIGMSVTPAILSRDLCLKLADYLKPSKGTWADVLCRLHNPKSPSNWTLGRVLKSKWTEYSLYYLCSMKLGLLDKYHVRAGTDEHPQLLLVHESHPFETWDTAQSFAAGEPGLFCVVGSKSGLEPRVIWERVQAYVPEPR